MFSLLLHTLPRINSNRCKKKNPLYHKLLHFSLLTVDKRCYILHIFVLRFSPGSESLTALSLMFGFYDVVVICFSLYFIKGQLSEVGSKDKDL